MKSILTLLRCYTYQIRLLIGGAFFSILPQVGFGADGVIKAGMVQTTVKMRGSGAPIVINGAAMSFGLALDMTPKLGFEAALQPLVDFQTREISRNSINGTLSWNIVGSSRQFRTQSDLGTLVYHGGSAFSLLLRGGIQYYQVYIEKSDSSIKGSTINAMSGMAYRYDIDEADAIGIEFLGTIVSFANSVEGLSSREYEFGLFFRRLI